MSGDYISREAALTVMERLRDKCGYDEMVFALNWASRLIRDTPAADVVEVVRCGECIFWDTSWNPGVGMKGEAHYCPRCHLVTLKDSFCSGGYRKNGGQDNV